MLAYFLDLAAVEAKNKSASSDKPIIVKPR
jgi:hypothetical protein